MNKFLLDDYLKKIDISIKYFPIDLYFLHERINRNKGEKKDEITNSFNSEIVPNTLKKYDYSGYFISIPTSPLSQVLNHKKLIKIESASK